MFTVQVLPKAGKVSNLTGIYSAHEKAPKGLHRSGP
jgi:hypothetical protein